MKTILNKTLSVLLILLIVLPLAMVVVPMAQNQSLVKAASSATITLDISEGYVGDYVTVTGRGFTPDKDVAFMWGNQLHSSLGFIGSMPRFQRPSYDKPGEAWTDALGNFIVQLQVPKLKSGTYTIKASDTETSATVSFTINPKVVLRNQYAYQTHGKIATPEQYTSSQHYISLFLAEGFVGDKLALQLSGFGDGEMVEVKIGTTKIKDFTVGSGTAEGYLFDTASVELVVPQLPSGDYTVTATGSLSAITASTTFKVTPELFLAKQTTPPPYDLGFPWFYTSGSFGLGWYSSIGTAVDSTFMFEATGLTGTTIQSVTLTYTGGSVTCTLSGTLTITSGSTQGITASTAPFTGTSPFGASSPVAKIPSALTSGKMLNVMITTDTASFTFINQLFSSTPSTSDLTGTLVWVEGDSTISSDGTSLTGFVGEDNEIVITGLKASASSLFPSLVCPTGSTIQDVDLDALSANPLTWYDQDVTPVSFYDANTNSQWDIDETVYVDNDNSGTVTIGDDRVTLLTLDGSIFLPWSTVAGVDADLTRSLVEFPKSTRPGLRLQVGFHKRVYLDKNGDSITSKGDTRISPLLTYLTQWGPNTADLNGFFARTLEILEYPGDLQYTVGLWNRGVSTYGVQAGNTISMQVMPQLLSITTPTSYQSAHYVTEGSSVTIRGNGFFGAEPLTIAVGGKYVTSSPTPPPVNAYGVLDSTSITMPALTGGEQTVSVQGMFTTDNTASVNVTYTPALSVSYSSPAYNLNPVTPVTVTGKGFEASTYQIVFDGVGIGEAVTSAFTVATTGDFAGQINIAFNTPTGVEGIHIVDVVKTSDPTKSAFYGKSYFTTGAALRDLVYPSYPTDSEFPTVTINPSLQRTPTTTTVGSNVTVTGKGLQPSTTYYIWYDPRGTSTSQAVLMTTTPATVATDAKGTLTATFQAPQSSGVTHYIWVSTSNTHVDNDPESGSPVLTSVSISPAMTLSPSSGAVGASIAVSFTGLSTSSQYQLWWYKPEEANVNLLLGVTEVPQTATPLATVTGALYGNSTSAVSFTVLSTAEAGKVYSVDLTTYASRYSELDSPVFFTVGNVATKITLNLTPATVTQGEGVAINGIIEPATSVNITLYITDSEGISRENKTVLSSVSGTFTHTFKPDKAGTWWVIAKWDGDATYAAFTSLAATVTVKPIDVSWTYAVTGLAIGAIALVAGLITIYYYFVRKKRAAATV